MQRCSYPPCGEPATVEFDLDNGVGRLCDQHAAQAVDLKQRLTAMSDEEYRAYIKDLVDAAPALSDIQRARLSRLLQSRRANPQ